MGRETGRLTALGIKSCGPGKHADGGNLYLIVSDTGAKRWSFIYRERGTSAAREIGFGGLATVGLAKAREMAARARLLLLEGKDPKTVKLETKALSNGPTFETMLDELYATIALGFKNKKHRKQWLAQVKRHAKVLLPMKVNEIATLDVHNALKTIWNTNPETGSRVRQRIERVLDWAKATGHRVGDNPARWRGNLDIALTHPRELKTVRHQPALPYGELPTFMAKLRAFPGIDARALEFTILTCMRTDEVLGAQWTEFDLEKALWSVPGPRMKKKAPHTVPLTPRAVAILKRMQALQQDVSVFPGRKRGKPRCDSALLRVVRKIRADVTTHGFRSTFRDWVYECTDFQREIAEAALAHAVGDKTERAYRRVRRLTGVAK